MGDAMIIVDRCDTARQPRGEKAPRTKIRWSVMSLCSLLAACDKPDVAACEQFIQAGLKAPSTYRRITIESHDIPTTRRQFWADAGLPDPIKDPSSTIRALAQLEDRAKITRRTTYISYDADNGMGVPIRGLNSCTFKLVDGELPSADRLRAAATSAASEEGDAVLIERGLLPPEFSKKKPNVGFECCFR